MNQENFEKYYKNTPVRVVWDNSITGKIIDYEDGLILIKTEAGDLKAFPLNQLEWVD